MCLTGICDSSDILNGKTGIMQSDFQEMHKYFECNKLFSTSKIIIRTLGLLKAAVYTEFIYTLNILLCMHL